MGDRFFKGQWLVNYCEQDYTFQQIWILLQQVDQWLPKQERPLNKIFINFQKGIPANTGRCFRDRSSGKYDISLTLRDGTPVTPAEEEITDMIPDSTIDMGSPVRTISLLMPFLESDTRWRKLDLTSSALFLGSALANQGFVVKAQKLNLPMQNLSSDVWQSDLIGFTLFEDLLPECMDMLDQAPWKSSHNLPVLAAGGPLVTLNPLQAVYHLPAINLFVRGEGEMVFDRLLGAINDNDLPELWRQKGFLLQKPGTIILSDFNLINRPGKFNGFSFNLDFLKEDQLAHGLEVNFSRGCSRSCLFCCQVQGKRMRKLPLKNVSQLVELWLKRIEGNGTQSGPARIININDDDLLQDREYAGQVFQLLKRNGCRLWGIQTSFTSFFDPQEGIVEQSMDLIDDAALFVEERPLLWLGTDVFLQQWAKRLGKGYFQAEALESLVSEFEKRGILNYHYWISSDHLSDWQEFVREFTFIYYLLQHFEHFALLPHAPFVIPYFTTPLFRLLQTSEKFKKQIIYKNTLSAPLPYLQLPLVARVETCWPNLNRLLANESLAAGHGFFNSIKERDYLSAFQSIYGFLRQDRLLVESEDRGVESEKLKILEAELEDTIGSMMSGS